VRHLLGGGAERIGKCPLLAQSGHAAYRDECLLLAEERTSL